MKKHYTVYVQIDEHNRISAINSSAFLDNIENWIQIDEGMGDKYAHAQGNYFDKPIYTEQTIPRYKLVNSKLVERTSDEVKADKSETTILQPTVKQLKQQITQLHSSLNEIYQMIANLKSNII